MSTFKKAVDILTFILVLGLFVVIARGCHYMSCSKSDNGERTEISCKASLK